MSQAAPKNYPKFERGVYEGITGIEFIKKNESGQPIFTAKERFGVPTLIAYFRTLVGDTQGPPGTVSPGDVSLLVHAFGADPSRLPDQQDPSFLDTAEQLINASGGVVSAYAHKAPNSDSAWIRTVYGADLPAGTGFLFTFKGVTSRRDGQPIWYEGEYGDYARTTLQVWANADGTATPFAGATAELYINRPALVILRALLGTVMDTLIGPPERELAVLEEVAAEANGARLIFARIVDKSSGKGTTILKESLRPVDPNAIPSNLMAVTAPKSEAATPVAVPATPAATPGPAPAATPGPAPVAAPTVSLPVHSQAMTALRAVIAQGTATEFASDAYDDAGRMTAQGKNWCREHLKPIAERDNLPQKFSDMSDADCIAYATALGKRDLLVRMGVVADDPDEEGDWGD